VSAVYFAFLGVVKGEMSLSAVKRA